MELYLPRIIIGGPTTLGHLFLQNDRFCYTLEDQVRAPGIKIPGKTAILEGLYRIVVTYSPRFKRNLPLIMNVPMYAGIRIHRGATAANSEGCVIAGYDLIRNDRVSSDTAADNLTRILLEHDEEHTILIKNIVGGKALPIPL